jgi:hypothetical protein
MLRTSLRFARARNGRDVLTKAQRQQDLSLRLCANLLRQTNDKQFWSTNETSLFDYDAVIDQHTSSVANEQSRTLHRLCG